ncbi:uncharacterized protein N7459_001962 [Penicillium hispanicum]|uniref:uncharacterized protein n=1 Tax=Penicillium hispanicum TaxID=1080232 RepID=UPI0025418D2B|nr:uncharacterized protein N7459_001962 [Penicillium hispanicum]KAJ5591593.1 hypothetical protein N7459_001962 [Penicillium hispanicum]
MENGTATEIRDPIDEVSDALESLADDLEERLSRTDEESPSDENADDGEEVQDDVSNGGFETAFRLALNGSQHTQYVHETLSYLGRQVDDSSLAWETIFLHLHEMDEELKRQIDSFSRGVSICNRLFSRDVHKLPLAPSNRRQTWPSQDITIDVRWNNLVQDITQLSNRLIVPATLTKPTGTWDAPLAIIWNYPSWSSQGCTWGQVLDVSNPCVRMHRWLNTRSKVIIILSKENCSLPRESLIEIDDSSEVVKVALRPHKGRPMLFGMQPWFEVVRNRKTKAIRQLIFLSYHTQTFLYDTHPWDVRVYHDLVWNAACGLAHCLVRRAINLRKLEKQNGSTLPEQAILYAFRHMMLKNPSFLLVPDINGSYVGTIIRFYVSKAWQKQHTQAWRKSPEGARMFDTAIINLLDPKAIQKRLATNKELRDSEAWKNSEAAREVLQGSKKGARRTKRCNAWSARTEALLKTKQVREILSAGPDELTACQRRSQERLQGLRSD